MLQIVVGMRVFTCNFGDFHHLAPPGWNHQYFLWIINDFGAQISSFHVTFGKIAGNSLNLV